MDEEQERRGLAVEEPPELREEVRRAVDTLLEGTDEEVEAALEELDSSWRPP